MNSLYTFVRVELQAHRRGKRAHAARI